VAAVLVCCVVGYRLTVRWQSLVCKGAEESLTGIWDSARQDAIHRAFLATGKPYAEDAFRGMKRALDLQTQAWVAMNTDACRATRVRKEQSEAVLDLRMGCLQRRLEEMQALTDLFAQADGQVVEKSVEAAGALVPLRSCSDLAALASQVKPPQDAASAAQ